MTTADTLRDPRQPMAHEALATKADRLAVAFAGRAAQHDQNDSFVAENYEQLKSEGLIAAAVPQELGGQGAALGEMADVVRRIAHGCGSTALAFSMHTHQVVIPGLALASPATRRAEG